MSNLQTHLCDNITIWNELTKFDYLLNTVQIVIQNYSVSTTIIFNKSEDLESFTNVIYEKYLQTMNNVEPHNNSLSLNFVSKNGPIYYFEKMSYPPNIEILEIMISTDPNTKYSFMNHHMIKLDNLPENLQQLKISSLFEIDLSNIPLSLILLDISQVYVKTNLENLPNNLQILYLPSNSHLDCDENYKSKCIEYSIYELDDLANLPNSLIEINFGLIKFKSINDLFDNFDKLIKVNKYFGVMNKVK